MADDLTQLVTQGFTGVTSLLKERDEKASLLSDKIIRMEGILESVRTSVGKVEVEMSRIEREGMTIRVKNLEDAVDGMKRKQDRYTFYILTLLVSVIFALIGVVGNFILVRLK